MEKSANPLSPSVAGPIAGVTISQPNLLEPGQDWQILPRDQPVRLMFQNADTSGARALFYTLEVASDAEFKNIVFTRTRVEPGSGVTTFQLPDALPAGRTYWWRVRAEDGANVGEYSKPMSFSAVAPVTLTAPTAVIAERLDHHAHTGVQGSRGQQDGTVRAHHLHAAGQQQHRVLVDCRDVRRG